MRPAATLAAARLLKKHSAVIIGCDLHSTPLRLCSALRRMGSVDLGDTLPCLVVTCQGTLHLQQQA